MKQFRSFYKIIWVVVVVSMLVPMQVNAKNLYENKLESQATSSPSTPLADALCTIFVTSNASSELLSACSADGATWNTALRVGSHLSKTAPASAVFKGKLCVVYTADNPSNDILVTCSPNGVTWPHDVRVGAQTKFAPALAVFNNQLCIAYVANIDSNELFSTCSADGVNWPTSTTVHGQLSKTPPALAAFNGQLCIAFVANNPGNALLMTCSSDGVNYQDNLSVGGQLSRTGPALAVFNNKLCVAWVADNDSYQMLMQCSDNASNWGGNYLIRGYASDTAPTLSVFAGQLCVEFKENKSIGLFITCSGDSINYSEARRISNSITAHFSKFSPSLVPFTSSVDTNAITDGGFRPNPEGYKFPNYGYGDVLPTDLTVDDLRSIFGDSAVCRSITNNVCNPNPAAVAWVNTWTIDMEGGHCYGMAVTAARFQRGMDFPSQFQVNAVTTHELDKANIRRHIASFHVRQSVSPARDFVFDYLSPVQVLMRIRDSFAYPTSDPFVLAIFEKPFAHAITPYSVRERGNNTFWIMVYDNNWPNDANRHVEINATSNTWSYELEPGNIWRGSMSLIPLSSNNAMMRCPFCANRSIFTNGTVQILVNGENQSYVTDQQGRTVGQVGNQIKNEIPGAQWTTIINGPDKIAPMLYEIPLTETLTTVLSGEGLAQTKLSSIAQFGPGFALNVADIAFSPATQDKITVATDGSAIKYESNEQKSINVGMAFNHDGATLSHASTASSAPDFNFIISSLPVSTSVSLIVNDGGQLVVYNRNGASGAYDLQVERVDTEGKEIFEHTSVNLSAGDVQYLNFNTWSNVVAGDKSAPLILQIDAGGDGTIDISHDLSNQSQEPPVDFNQKLYLPLVTKG